MIPFKKKILRLVRLRSSVAGLPVTDWIVAVGPQGFQFRRRGAPKESSIGLTWRQVIGMALIHKGERSV